MYPYQMYLWLKFRNDPAISSGFVFLVLAPWWPSQESDLNKIWHQLLLPSGTYVQSFGSIALVVTKRAQLTDDNGCHMIAYAHQVSQWLKSFARRGSDPRTTPLYNNVILIQAKLNIFYKCITWYLCLERNIIHKPEYNINQSTSSKQL
jgi:hypothetical protein